VPRPDSFLTPSVRRAVRYAASALLTFLFLALAFRGTDFSRLGQTMANAHYGWMVLNLAALLASHWLRAWRWRYLLNPVKKSIGVRNLFSGVMIGYLLNNVLPRAGELARAYAIGKLEGVPAGAAFGTIVAERIIDVISFLVLIILLPLVYNGPLRESFPWLVDLSVAIACVTGVVVVLIVMLALRRDWTDRLLSWVLRVLPRRGRAATEKTVHSFLDGFLVLQSPGAFMPVVLLSAAVWSLYILMMYVALYAFDLEALGVQGALVIQALSSIGFAVPTPGAMGSYHAITSQTLSRLFSVDPAVALSYAMVTHAVGYVGVTIVGAYFFIRDHISMREAVAREGSAQ
jgi:uncharacterized protein (TIRG00374 family)